MKLTVEKALELSKQANELKNDLELLQFAKDNKGFIKVLLDNDASDLIFNTDGLDYETEQIIDDIELPYFSNYHGWEDSIIELFQFAGIDAEPC